MKETKSFVTHRLFAKLVPTNPEELKNLQALLKEQHRCKPGIAVIMLKATGVPVETHYVHHNGVP